MDINLKPYYDYTVSPLGKLFYHTVHTQLGDLSNRLILDFGSGFGHTAGALALQNKVTAIEPDEKMIQACDNIHGFEQIHGDVAWLADVPSETYDVVICHLVFEFAGNTAQIINELCRVLKKDGFISVVRHNRYGRLIQAIVCDYDLGEAKNLIEGGYSYSSAFGDIKYYENDELISLAQGKLRVEREFGVRALASLHGEERTSSKTWLKEMTEIERELLKQKEFIDISYFKHIILKKA